MAYSRNKRAVERVEPILKTLVQADTDLVIPSPMPHKLAYAIRDGIKVAQLYAKQYPGYGELDNKYKFCVRTDGVFAERKRELEFSSPIIALAQAFVRMTVEEADTALAVVGACIKHKAPEFEFPNAMLDDRGLTMVKTWAIANSYEITQTTPLTLVKVNGSTDRSHDGGA